VLHLLVSHEMPRKVTRCGLFSVPWGVACVLLLTTFLQQAACARPEPGTGTAVARSELHSGNEHDVVVFTPDGGRHAEHSKGEEVHEDGLSAHQAAASGRPVRRKLINLQTPGGTLFFHQPLVNCLTYNATNTSALAAFYPSCCTLDAPTCAARCESVPTCKAFKFAWYMNTQPPASSVPAVAPGQQWTWCLLVDWYDITTCTAELRWDPNSNASGVPQVSRPQDIWDMYYKAANQSYTAAGTWNLLFSAWYQVAALQPPPPPGNSSQGTAVVIDKSLTAGLAVGLGVPFCLAVGAGLLLAVIKCGLLPGLATSPKAPAHSAAKTMTRSTDDGGEESLKFVPDPSRQYDVFVSYRRQHLKVADTVHSKLLLAGLRVFFDRSGGMAGRPFETELFKAVRDSPVFAPIIMLEDFQFWSKHDAKLPDYTLAEYLIAMHWARKGRVQLVFPLLVGEWSEGTTSHGGDRDYLLRNPKFKTYRDALPDIAPAATIARVNSMFASVEGAGEGLDPVLQKATVRDIIVGSLSKTGATQAPAGAAAASKDPSPNTVRGMLEMDAVLLYGPDEQAGLVLRHRYAESCLTALYGQR